MDFAVIPNVKQEIPNLVKNDKAIETAINTVTNYMKPLRVTVDQLHHDTTGELKRAVTCIRCEQKEMFRDVFKKKKNRNVGHCPKRWEGVQTGSQISEMSDTINYRSLSL